MIESYQIKCLVQERIVSKRCKSICTMGEPDSVPLIDLSSFSEEASHDAQKEASKALCDACHTHGFANIVGHGLSSERLNDSFTFLTKLFDLPHHEKTKAPHPPSSIPIEAIQRLV